MEKLVFESEFFVPKLMVNEGKIVMGGEVL